MQQSVHETAKLAELLVRIGASRGNPRLTDCAMAGIYGHSLAAEVAAAPAQPAPEPPRPRRVVRVPAKQP